MAMFSPFLFVATVIVALLVIMGEASAPTPKYLKYTTVTGYFQQDDPATDDRNFDYVGNLNLAGSTIANKRLLRQLQISASSTGATVKALSMVR